MTDTNQASSPTIANGASVDAAGNSRPVGVAAGLSLFLTPLRTAISQEGGVIDVLVRVQAPEQPATTGAEAKPRTPLRLALVVDRSGSMSGQPLQEALRCVQHIGERLQPNDELAVVLYDNEVEVPLPLAKSPGAQAVARALAGVYSGGSTDLHAGWDAGARQLQQGALGTISRVLLLSDGQANCGQIDPAVIAQRCSHWLERGVSTTTVGLGRMFNEDLMVSMANAGGGQQYYGQRAEDLFDAFDEELALLQAMMLRQLRIKPVGAAGVIVEPLGQMGRQHNADGSFSLPDLAWDAEAWMLLRLHVPRNVIASSTAVGPNAGCTLLAVSLEGFDLDGHVQTLHATPLVLPVWPASDVAALPMDETVARRLQEVEFAELNMHVRELLRQGHRAQAQAALARAQSKVADHPWLLEKLARLKALLAEDALMAQKEMLYSSGKMTTRLAAKFERSDVSDETDAAHISSYVRRKSAEGKGRKQ